MRLRPSQPVGCEQRELEYPLIGKLPSADRRGWLLTRDFGFLWWSQLVSQVADGVSKLALLWFVYSITGSAIQTSVIGLLQTVPAIIFSPVIGVTVDRFAKKPILIGSDLVRALLIGVIPCWVSAEAFTVESLYLLVFLYGIATAVFVPTLSASVPFLVSRSQFTAANALLQGTTSLGIFLGPALSGIGIAASGSQEVLCANSLTYLVSVACLLPIRLPRAVVVPREGGPLRSAIRDLGEGVAYTFFKQRIIAQLIVIASLYTFSTGAFTTLFPIFGKKMLNLGPVEVGYLWSVLGFGLLLVSIGLVWVTGWQLRNRTLAIAVSSAIAGVALVWLIWARDLLIATLLMGIIGMGIGTLTPIAWGVLQEVSPAHLVGRVMGIYTTLATASSMVGMTVFGWVTQEFSEPMGIIGIGSVLIVMALVSVECSRRVGGWRPIPIVRPTPGIPVDVISSLQRMPPSLLTTGMAENSTREWTGGR